MRQRLEQGGAKSGSIATIRNRPRHGSGAGEPVGVAKARVTVMTMETSETERLFRWTGDGGVPK